MSTNLQDAASVGRERLLSSSSDCRNGCESDMSTNDNAWKISASPLLLLTVTHCIQAVGAYTEKGECYSAMTQRTCQYGENVTSAGTLADCSVRHPRGFAC